MLISTKKLKDYNLQSLSGNIGNVKEIYFDDRYWTIRYLTGDTGNWLFGNKVLISPYAIAKIDSEEKTIKVELTKKQIEDSPPIELEAKISNQYEHSFFKYYRWPAYWQGPHAWGAHPDVIRNNDHFDNPSLDDKIWNPSLHAVKEISGYTVEASDGDIGHVDDFLIDLENWSVRYLILDTKNWWPGNQVIVSPDWIERISFDEKKVYMRLTREQVKSSFTYVPEVPVTRSHEIELFANYGRAGYWEMDVEAAE